MDNTDIATLNSNHAIPGHVSFKEGPGGLSIAEVANAHATASIVLQGAHVFSFVPRGEQEIIWLSSQVRSFKVQFTARLSASLCYQQRI